MFLLRHCCLTPVLDPLFFKSVWTIVLILSWCFFVIFDAWSLFSYHMEKSNMNILPNISFFGQRKKKKKGFEMTWGWVIGDRIFIFCFCKQKLRPHWLRGCEKEQMFTLVNHFRCFLSRAPTDLLHQKETSDCETMIATPCLFSVILLDNL